MGNGDTTGLLSIDRRDRKRSNDSDNGDSGEKS
jgi:hypothetical protein